MHHIVTDGWGVAVLAKELGVSYSALRRGRLPDLRPPRRQYADFVAAQTRYMTTDEFERDLAYWKQTIDPTRKLALPDDRGRPSAPGHVGARLTTSITGETWARLSASLISHRVTPFAAAVGFMTIVLRHWSAQTRFLLGTDFANRNEPEDEDLVGLCANQAVLSIDFPEKTTMLGWMKHLTAIIATAGEHARAPFGSVVDAVGPKRSERLTPLFQAKIVGQPSTPALELDGLAVSRFVLPHQTAKFDLLLSLSLEPTGWTWDVEYDRELFHEATILEFVRDLEFLADRFEPYVTRDLEGILWDLDLRAADVHDLARDALSTFLSASDAVSATDPVIVERPASGGSLPVVVQRTGQDPALTEWLEDQHGEVEQLLLDHGAVLFRGFGLTTAQEFEAVAQRMARDSRLMDYEENTSPRTTVLGRVATSTDYPPNRSILLHHEHSYSRRPPRKLFFFCREAPRTGGATPLASARAVTRKIRPALRAKFRERGWALVQNFHPGIGRSWKDVFRCKTRAELEFYCSAADIALTWNGPSHVRAVYRRPAEIVHPDTGESVWFNHIAFWHSSSFDPDVRDRLWREFDRGSWPCHTRYADGTEIDDADVREIAAAYESAACRFDWQTGDLLVLDNVLTAHGREPFEGPRDVLFCMAEPFDAARAGEVAR
jgi:alpha-ketoglutarate-dependent taurine dioxygenase